MDLNTIIARLRSAVLDIDRSIADLQRLSVSRKPTKAVRRMTRVKKCRKGRAWM